MQWGSLYNSTVNGGKPQDYDSRIETLQKEIDKFQIPRMTTVSKTSYKDVKGYEEWHDHKRRSLERVKENELHSGNL